MKTEFKSLSREFFEEYYYVVTNIKKFVKKPERKIHSILNNLFIYVVLAFVFFISTICFGIFVDEQLRTFVVLPAFALLIILLAYGATARKLRTLGKAKYNLTFSSTKKTATIALSKEDQLSLDWKDVKKIICGNHAIIFIPNDIMQAPIAIPKSGLKKLKDTLKEYKLTKLLA